MRDKIRLPADVELSTNFIALKDGATGGENVEFTIESVPAGKFNKITKIVIKMAELGEVITITPKERRPNYNNVRPLPNPVVKAEGEQ